MKDCKQGYGVVSNLAGFRYEGTWHKNLREGYGIEVYKDGGKLFILQIVNDVLKN